MRIQSNSISLLESCLGMFWYAVYEIARLFIFTSRVWLGIADKIGMTLEKQKNTGLELNQDQFQNQ